MASNGQISLARSRKCATPHARARSMKRLILSRWLSVMDEVQVVHRWFTALLAMIAVALHIGSMVRQDGCWLLPSYSAINGQVIKIEYHECHGLLKRAYQPLTKSARSRWLGARISRTWDAESHHQLPHHHLLVHMGCPSCSGL